MSLPDPLERPEGDRHGWLREAACRGLDPDMFFPPEGKGPGATAETRRLINAAKAVCATCPVVTPCLADALAWSGHMDMGIQGGTTPSERRKLRRGLPVPDRRCDWCGRMFAPPTRSHALCSEDCRAASRRAVQRANTMAKRERRREEREAEPVVAAKPVAVTPTCVACGWNFRTPNYEGLCVPCQVKERRRAEATS